MPIEKDTNYDDTFLRDVNVAVLEALNNRIYWYNKWENEERKINVPFYYSMTGDDRFLIDAFVDDIPGKRIEQNYDVVPRGVVTLEETTIMSNEFTNPHVKVSRYIEDNNELKMVVSKIRNLPLQLTYDIKMRVASELDLYKCHQAIWNLLFQYQYFYFEHNFIRIDCSFVLPNAFQTKIERNITMTSDLYMEHSFRLDVHTYYPLFGDIERMPASNKVQWNLNFWKLRGSGAEKIDPLSTNFNQYPPDSSNKSENKRKL